MSRATVGKVVDTALRDLLRSNAWGEDHDQIATLASTPRETLAAFLAILADERPFTDKIRSRRFLLLLSMFLSLARDLTPDDVRRLDGALIRAAEVSVPLDYSISREIVEYQTRQMPVTLECSLALGRREDRIGIAMGLRKLLLGLASSEEHLVRYLAVTGLYHLADILGHRMISQDFKTMEQAEGHGPLREMILASLEFWSARDRLSENTPG